VDTDDDRRRAPRERAYVGVEIRVPSGKARLAVLQDASETGVLLLTHSRVEVGDQIELGIQIDGETRLDLAGTVVRVEPLHSDGPWRVRVGVAIDEPSLELAKHAALIHARQALSSGERE
jgi:hypothetical protein